jgi:hypothetical protein
LDLEERSTLRGLTSGVVKLRSDATLRLCVVFGGLFCSWLSVLRELGYRAILVFLRGEDYLDAVEALVGDKCAVWSASDWKALHFTMPSFSLTRNIIGFVEGRVTGELRSLAEGMGVQTLVSTKGA